MSHDVMQSFVTLSANSPCFTIKTESFAHALDNDDSAKPRNCSIVTRPFPSLRAGSGYETKRRSDMPAITSLSNEIFADAAFIPHRECMGS